MLIKKVYISPTRISIGCSKFSFNKSCREPMRELTTCSFRSSHQRCSMKKGVLRNFTKFTEKHLCQCLFFNKVAGLWPKFLKTPAFLTEHIRTTASLLYYGFMVCIFDEIERVDWCFKYFVFWAKRLKCFSCSFEMHQQCRCKN